MAVQSHEVRRAQSVRKVADFGDVPLAGFDLIPVGHQYDEAEIRAEEYAEDELDILGESSTSPVLRDSLERSHGLAGTRSGRPSCDSCGCTERIVDSGRAGIVEYCADCLVQTR